MNDLTIIYLTANRIPERFAKAMRSQLLNAIGTTKLISVSKEAMKFPLSYGFNMPVASPRSHINIYRQGLIGAKEAMTQYIAIAEDDILYPKEHFRKRPTRDNVFAYNTACWSIYTWSKPPMFSYTGRRNHGMLICDRKLYIEALEERFSKFTDDSQINNAIWAEPGKYERQLGVTVRESEFFYTDPSCVMFTHPEGLSMDTLGTRKRLAPIRALEIPHWGRAEEVVKFYE